MYTLKQLTVAAKPFGIVRAKGTYNGLAFLKYENSNSIITKDRLIEILGV